MLQMSSITEHHKQILACLHAALLNHCKDLKTQQQYHMEQLKEMCC